jgi:hypothetical protein
MAFGVKERRVTGLVDEIVDGTLLVAQSAAPD